MITGAPADLLLRVFTLDVVRMPQNPGVTQACLQPAGQNLDQSPQDTACGPPSYGRSEDTQLRYARTPAPGASSRAPAWHLPLGSPAPLPPSAHHAQCNDAEEQGRGFGEVTEPKRQSVFQDLVDQGRKIDLENPHLIVRGA